MNEFLARLLKAYRAAEKRSGVTFDCLAEGGDRTRVMAAEVLEDTITVRIQGPMDGFFGVSSSDVIAELDKADAKKIVLLVESPGGFVSEGLALYADLRARAKAGIEITAESRGVVASAAVLPYLAADTRTMGDGTMIMVHNPWGFLIAIGDYADIDKETKGILNGLKAHTTNYASILADRTGMTSADATKVMNAETWYTAEEAISAGYAKTVTDEPLTAADTSVIARARLDAAASIISQFGG